MSFSADTKRELCEYPIYSPHCRLAELSAFTNFMIKANKAKKPNRTANEAFIARRYHMLCSAEDRAGADAPHEKCCQRAFVRGCFIVYGTLCNPDKTYHMEFSLPTAADGDKLFEILRNFGLNPRQTQRRGQVLVYLKESEHIVDALNIMGAHRVLLELENMRILKEINNQVNRQVNFETANLNKTVSAAVQQIKDIRFIAEHAGLGVLPKPLEEVARLRLAHNDATLKEIGEMLSPPVGKSGVNHRLRKISAVAAGYKEEDID